MTFQPPIYFNISIKVDFPLFLTHAVRSIVEARELPSKTRVVGWPPVRSYRKNCFQAKKTEEAEQSGSGMYVKVSMDGAPYLRTMDLKFYKRYPELLKAMEAMFKCSVGVYSEREGYKGSDFAPTYEDKDGDWMLVGDVPWEIFATGGIEQLRQTTR